MLMPKTPKRFRNWLDRHQPALPDKLYFQGIAHGLCLNTISLNRGNAEALKAARRITAAPMKEFMTAYADWKARTPD